MKLNSLKKSLIAGLTVATMSGATVTANAADRDYILATASTGGTYYPVGVAIATLSKVKLQPKFGMSLSAISSAGSGENVKLLRENQAQFAILQGLYGAWAWNGEGPLKQAGKQTELRSVSMLWQNVEHFVLRKNLAKTGTVADLKDLEGSNNKFSIGKKNSGTEGSGRQLLSGLNIDPDKFSLAFMGYGPSADAMQNGNIEGMNTPAGVPVSAVTRLYASMGNKVKVLDFTDEQMKEANGSYDLWTRYVIPANTYPGQEKAINTIAQPNFLATRADTSEEDIYQLTKSLYENLPYLSAIHKATSVMSIDKAIAGLPVPLHPGAARYYKEQGIEIPDSLIAN
ncbi:TAXI family TRAP transporter solute-binding subunit [Marinomonas mediterranea]|jgi:TRAP transporter solute receptor, TAXI family|uniref:TRAP transporter solute receptor, TAXI family n=1 Tax=Marinomonas mediterranea (strain ATCC 700492 / JCM 21426 / NBRC 103028 / MMB-1) TaxID=717774 RepID=F2K2F9_MARM1|nr:TAXI family TRAP transporter solute-binding subunit [Marinomonas mediterranea]ADZ92339.1 TRAP transporter solute receptor, TAXI family [Marinomonas mediterranea MMB-1]WCN10291.1 TAXI family TRAP transporter solute-binding subunit [Marinomonas mediterranea]WCN14337.1 TAXI family TRAP transporter solute-binding subunit [Marinomonas mediterranea]WCN18388.1 TAXI family TRAP transporter solute-binding subunit [Marinomonas mediterranea MMB-1]